MSIRRAFVAACAALLLLPALSRPARADDVIRVATIPIDVGAEVFFAQDAGFFKQAGIDVKIDAMSNGSAIAAAVASGAVDIGFSSLVSLAIAYKSGIPVTVVAPAGVYSAAAPTSACLVAAKSPIATAKDLDGKIFATNGLKDIAEFGPRAWIDANGGDSKTVKFVEMPFPAMPAALASGRADAALVAEPVLSRAKATTRVLSDCFTAIAPRFLIAGYFTTSPWAKAHPALVAKFQEALRRTAEWANAHQTESGQMLASSTRIPLPVIRKMTRSVFGVRLEPAMMQPVIDLTARYGAIPRTFPASEIIYAGH